jgi:hypothetical protein
MSTAALPNPASVTEPNLAVKNVLRDTRNLYKLLVRQSVGLGLFVFGALELVRVGMDRTPSVAPAAAALIGVALSFVGTSLVQGALAESVRDVHLGADPASIGQSYQRAAARIGSLVGVAVLSALGIVLGVVLLLVPGLVLMARWAVAVPVVMYEGATPRAALKRSSDLVRGHGRAVFTVLVNVGFRVGVVGFAVGAAAGTVGGFLAMWIGLTVGSAVTTPYAAHALSVLYYRLTEPNRPLIPEPGRRWESVWHAEAGATPDNAPTPDEPNVETIEEEYIRKFEERAKQWGG